MSFTPSLFNNETTELCLNIFPVVKLLSEIFDGVSLIDTVDILPLARLECLNLITSLNDFNLLFVYDPTSCSGIPESMFFCEPTLDRCCKIRVNFPSLFAGTFM